MAIRYHPDTGTVVICDFKGFIEPEMVKRRLAVVISPRHRRGTGLCTIVPLSTTEPRIVCSYHCKLIFDEPLPEPYNSTIQWVKADMLATVSFERLFIPSDGREENGRRKYVIKVLNGADLRNIRKCVLSALALSHLNAHL